jgi:hypothetical protein
MYFCTGINVGKIIGLVFGALSKNIFKFLKTTKILQHRRKANCLSMKFWSVVCILVVLSAEGFCNAQAVCKEEDHRMWQHHVDWMGSYLDGRCTLNSSLPQELAEVFFPSLTFCSLLN